MNLFQVQILKKENNELKRDFKSLTESFKLVNIQFSELKKSNGGLKKSNDELKKEIYSLKSKLEVSEHSRKLTSENSGKPPSSDGLKKEKRTLSLRKKSNKKQGGQPGHKGYTLKQVEKPDKIINIQVDECPNCQTDLSSVPIKNYKKRQVFDIEPSKLKVNEYRSNCKKCPKCKKKVKANFPSKVKGRVQYGPIIQALSPYLNNQQLLPKRRTASHFKETYKSSLCASTVFNLNKKLESQLSPYLSEIINYLENSEVKHLDETGFRILGKTCWLHSLSDKKATYYRASEKRGDVPENVKNIVVHDNYSSYKKLKEGIHVLCNIHHMRELKALKEIDLEEWAGDFYLLLDVLRRKKKYEFKSITKEYLSKTEILYEKILKKGFEYHESKPELPRGSTNRKRHRKGHNLLKRLRKNKEATLRFLYDEKAPFSNNQAERDIRMMKVKQKISGCFQTLEGGYCFSKIKSIFSTLSKQGMNILEGIAKIQNKELVHSEICRVSTQYSNYTILCHIIFLIKL